MYLWLPLGRLGAGSGKGGAGGGVRGSRRWGVKDEKREGSERPERLACGTWDHLHCKIFTDDKKRESQGHENERNFAVGWWN